MKSRVTAAPPTEWKWKRGKKNGPIIRLFLPDEWYDTDLKAKKMSRKLKDKVRNQQPKGRRNGLVCIVQRHLKLNHKWAMEEGRGGQTLK